MYMLVRAAQNVSKLFNETKIMKLMEITMKDILNRLENEIPKDRTPIPLEKLVNIDYID